MKNQNDQRNSEQKVYKDLDKRYDESTENRNGTLE